MFELPLQFECLNRFESNSKVFSAYREEFKIKLSQISDWRKSERKLKKASIFTRKV